jgi:hypothetical protein
VVLNNSAEKFDKVKGVVYKTTNGGQLWKEIWRGNNLGVYILIDPRNSNVLYLSTVFSTAKLLILTSRPGNRG